MLTNFRTWAAVAALLPSAALAESGTVTGTVVDKSGTPMHGVIVSAFDRDQQKSISVLTDMEGKFILDELEPRTYDVRARLTGFADIFQDEIDVAAGANNATLKFELEPVTGMELHRQRNGASLFGELKWDNEEERMSFKMNCTYCHQVGTYGFRTPEEPVDWQILITKMDGYGNLLPSLQKKVVQQLVDTYSDEAVAKWPEWTPPEPVKGKALALRVVEWDMGRRDMTMTHDLEIGKDGLVWLVDMVNDAIVSLDPKTGERNTYGIPSGKDPESRDILKMGPHSLEPDAEGNMWVTMAIGGKMGKFDVTKKEWTEMVSGAPDPAPRGGYPHTLRVDSKGVVWYTDAGLGVFKLDPNDGNKRTFYRSSLKGQNVGRGVGESRGTTPYGIAVAPNGDIWYTRLNGNRLGRVKPDLPPAEAVTEWTPPFIGPRRLEVAPDGMIWVPGCGSGVIGKFNPETEEWKVYDLPNKENEFPYALHVHPQTGDVWVCGTSTDSMYRFIPKTEELIQYPMPSRVTYTREVEFDEDGSVWVCNSNWPNRHTERGYGSLIKITLDGTVDDPGALAAKSVKTAASEK